MSAHTPADINWGNSLISSLHPLQAQLVGPVLPYCDWVAGSFSLRGSKLSPRLEAWGFGFDSRSAVSLFPEAYGRVRPHCVVCASEGSELHRWTKTTKRAVAFGSRVYTDRLNCGHDVLMETLRVKAYETTQSVFA